MKLWVSADARAYILAEAMYLRERNQPAADAFLQEMKEAQKCLLRFPDLGTKREDLPIPGARRLVVGNYLLDYRRDGDFIVIVSVRHGRQMPLVPQREENFDYENEVDESDALKPPGKDGI